MKIPIPVKMAVLALILTAFYTMVGQLVPQKEVYPPEEVEIADNITTEEMVQIGQEIFEGKGLCSTCHTIGKSGALRFPDLAGIGSRAGAMVEGLDELGYLFQSMYEPNVFVVEGFNPGMPAIDKPPIGLSHEEILTVVAYLQSLGGTASVTMDTTHVYRSGQQ